MVKKSWQGQSWKKNDSLLSKENQLYDGPLPVIVAALYGQKHMVNYLYSVTPKELFSPEGGKNGAMLINSLIRAEMYGKIVDVRGNIPICIKPFFNICAPNPFLIATDVASMLLQQYPKLGVTPDHNGDYALQLLAHKPSAFPSGTKLVSWKRWIYSC